MTTKNKITDIKKEQIPNLDYQGYLWFSDDSHPEVIDTKNPFDAKKLTDLPFVVEGMLYAPKDKVSIRIVNFNGDYKIAKMELVEMPEDGQKTYLLKKRFGNHHRIKMYEHWEEQPDPINQNRPVLQPAWSAFIGFQN